VVGDAPTTSRISLLPKMHRKAFLSVGAPPTEVEAVLSAVCDQIHKKSRFPVQGTGFFITFFHAGRTPPGA